MLSREVKERLREYETPFYLYDMELLRRTVECALREADRYGYRLHYAMKANNAVSWSSSLRAAWGPTA